jgi:hypothetical protein
MAETQATALIDALIAQGLAGAGEHDVVDALCRHLAGLGVPLLRAAVAGVGVRRADPVSLGRYALRSVARPQELPTLDRRAVADVESMG